METTRRSAKRTIFRNTAFVITAQFALRGVSFIFNVLVIRELGDSSFGQYSVVLAWAGLFSVLGDLGIAQYMTREIARDPNKTSQVFWDVAVLRFILAILAATVTILGAIAKPYDPEIVLAVALYTSSYFLQAILAPLISILEGNERLDIVSVFGVIGQVIFLTFGGLFLFAGWGFVWLVVASLINIPILILLTYTAVRRNKLSPPKFHVSPGTWLLLLRAGLPFALIQLSLTFAFQVDTLFLEHYFEPEVVGWYNSAYNLTRSLLLVTGAFTIAILPTLSREHATNPSAVYPWYYRSVKYMVFIGLPIAVGGTLLADKIILMLYGTEYAPGAVAFAILIWDTPLLMYTALCGNLTTSIQKERKAAQIYFIEGGVNISLNALLVPAFGLIAAGVTTVATEVTGAALFYILFRREFGPGLGLKNLIRFAAAALVMGVAVYFMRDLHLIVAIIIGGVVYLAAVILLRAFTVEERNELMSVIKRLQNRLIKQPAA